ncbi:MAG: riboflavin synthase [Clostridiales bacterium]|jgi:riboflavin synthase|nr:riboflavin synthase [Clostridiales bacterium]
MFTGIIEEIGTILSLNKGVSSVRLNIRSAFEDIRLGDSVAVNGVCLTADALTKDGFAADVMPETMRKTSFDKLRAGSKVNLERALRLDGRLGGHIVSGHIDGTGVIESFKKEDNAIWIAVRAPKPTLAYIVEKGSIALDGVSLTVASLSENSFSVSVIPHTARETVLLEKRPGDIINIECDVIGKYILKLASSCKQPKGRITADFLRLNGF